jgi:hypothetical protein
MRKYRRAPLEPLARNRFYAATIAFVLGLLLLAGPARLAVRDSLQTVAASFAITFLSVALIELLPEMARYFLERRERKVFVTFFGAQSLQTGFRLISAGRTIEPDYLHHFKPDPEPEGAVGSVPEGVRYWLAEQDIRACSYLSQTFALGGIPINFDIAKSIAHEPVLSASTIALGLGFNETTKHLRVLGSNLFTVDGSRYRQTPRREPIAWHWPAKSPRLPSKAMSTRWPRVFFPIKTRMWSIS